MLNSYLKTSEVFVLTQLMFNTEYCLYGYCVCFRFMKTFMIQTTLYRCVIID
jgi:hypothetical protein